MGVVIVSYFPKFFTLVCHKNILIVIDYSLPHLRLMARILVAVVVDHPSIKCDIKDAAELFVIQISFTDNGVVLYGTGAVLKLLQ